ncbi:MAG: hypothetical protein U0R68_14725 [Candidatus Nanopelagicales bacterium]
MNGPDVPSSGTPPTGGDPGYDAVIEDILAGRLGHEPEDEMSLVGLVDALRAPGSDEELGDVEAATSAFLAARSGAGAEAGSGVVVPLAPRRAGRAVVAVAAVLGAVVLVGGTAAAATGSLPPRLQDFAHLVLRFVPTADEAAASQSASPEASNGSEASSNGQRSSTAPTSPGKSQASPAATVGPTSPQLAAWCQAFASKTNSAAERSTAAKALQAYATSQNTTVVALCATVPKPGASGASNGSNGNGSTGKNGNPSPGTKPSNANSNAAGNGNGASNRATPTKPSQATSRPSNSNKPATPGNGNGNKPSTTP